MELSFCEDYNEVNNVLPTGFSQLNNVRISSYHAIFQKISFNFYPGLQMTDVELDERITALEESGSGFVNGQTNVFHFLRCL